MGKRVKKLVTRYRWQGALGALLVATVVVSGLAMAPGAGLSGAMVNIEGTRVPTFVGSGINVLSGRTFSDALESPVFVDSVFDTNKDPRGNTLIHSAPLNTAEGTSVIGDSLKDMYTGLDVSVEVKTGKSVPFFSGKVSSQFGNKRELKSEAKFYNSQFSATTVKHNLAASYTTPRKLQEIVDPDFLADVNDPKMTPKRLFEAYGTHIIVAASLGGSVNVSGLYNSDTRAEERDIAAALDFKSVWVEGQAKTQLTEKQKSIATETRIETYARGGDVGIFSGVGFDGLGAALKQWGGTVASNPTLASIDKTVAIWELAQDAGRQAAIENYFYEKADGVSADLMAYFTKAAAPPQPTAPDQTYIKNVYMGAHEKSEALAISDLLSKSNEAITPIRVDLNKGAGGHYIYIGYTTTTDPNAALRGIAFRTEQSAPKTFQYDGASYSKFGYDVNKGAKGEYIWMYASWDTAAGGPIKQLFVEVDGDLSGRSGATGWSRTVYLDGGRWQGDMELNKGAKGAYIFLWVNR